jgi:hypothetical protein
MFRARHPSSSGAISVFAASGLMMNCVPLETCWAFNEGWNNKFYYKVASCWLFLLSHTAMNWIGHILRRNCLLQRVTEGKIQGGIEVTGRQGRRRRTLLDDLKERRGYSHLKGEALDCTIWRARFGRGFGPVVRQTTKWNKYYDARIHEY